MGEDGVLANRVLTESRAGERRGDVAGGNAWAGCGGSVCIF